MNLCSVNSNFNWGYLASRSRWRRAVFGVRVVNGNASTIDVRFVGYAVGIGLTLVIYLAVLPERCLELYNSRQASVFTLP